MIPNIPSIPTDSLHKFYAVVGFLGILVIGVLSYLSLTNLSQKIDDWDLDIKKTTNSINYQKIISSEYKDKRNIMVKYLYEKVQDSIKILDDYPLFSNHIRNSIIDTTNIDTTIIMQNGRKYKKSIGKFGYSDSLYKSFAFYYKLNFNVSEKEKELLKELDLLNLKLDELEQKLENDIILLKVKDIQYVKYNDDYKKYFVVALILLLMFGYMAWDGLYHWSRYGQQYQDNILKLQYHELKTKLEKDGINVDDIMNPKKKKVKIDIKKEDDINK